MPRSHSSRPLFSILAALATVPLGAQENWSTGNFNHGRVRSNTTLNGTAFPAVPQWDGTGNVGFNTQGIWQSFSRFSLWYNLPSGAYSASGSGPSLYARLQAATRIEYVTGILRLEPTEGQGNASLVDPVGVDVDFHVVTGNSIPVGEGPTFFNAWNWGNYDGSTFGFPGTPIALPKFPRTRLAGTLSAAQQLEHVEVIGEAPFRALGTALSKRSGSGDISPIRQENLDIAIDITQAVKAALAAGELDDNGGTPPATGIPTDAELFVGMVWSERKPVYVANDPFWAEARQTLFDVSSAYLRLTFGDTVLIVPNTSLTSNAPGFATLRFPTVGGQNYQIEQSATLTSPTWSPRGDLIPGTGSAVEESIPLAGDKGFLRVTTTP